LEVLNIFAANGNNLTAIPESFGDLEPDTVFIHNNQIAVLPESLFDNSFQFFHIYENNLQFGSIEPFMDNGIVSFIYEPQGMIGQDTVVEVINGETLDFTLEVSGENNIYSWYKDGALLPEQTTNNLYIANATYDDQGTYLLKVTNSMVPDLELVSHDVEVSILTGLQQAGAKSFQLYPNPVQGGEVIIAVENHEKVATISIFSMNGDFVLGHSRITERNKLNISELRGGLYLVKVELIDGSTITEKMMVK
jgi:hypothetical protein